jgi:hypothetical protein
MDEDKELSSLLQTQRVSVGVFGSQKVEFFQCKMCQGTFSRKSKLHFDFRSIFSKLIRPSASDEKVSGIPDAVRLVSGARRCFCDRRVLGYLFSNGYVVDFTKIHKTEPVSFHLCAKRRDCDGMPAFNAGEVELQSMGCTKSIDVADVIVMIRDYQFSWWDEKGRDPSQWSKLRMCVPCAVESGVLIQSR